jgi:hypothetical protein
VVAQNETRTELRVLLAAPLIVFVLLLISSYFLSMPFGAALFFFTPEGSAFSKLSLPPTEFPMLLFMIFGFYIPVTASYGLAFLVLLGVYVVCFAVAWISRESLHDVVRKGFSRPFTKLFNNNLFAMPIIASMLFTAVIAIHFFQESQGIPTGSLPETDPYHLFFQLTSSPVLEEISFRISTIGIFLVVYLFLVGSKKLATLSGEQALKVALLIPLYPDKAKKLLGVKTVSEFGIKGISRGEWIMVIIASLAFGLAHYIFGWGPGKITTATLDGFAFGLAYLFYGIQAPILLHWFFNYYWYGFSLALDVYPNSFSLILIIFIVEIVTLIVGVLGWSIFAGLLGVRVYGRVKSWWYRRWQKTVPSLSPSTQLPPPTPSSPIIRFCRGCGRVLSEDMTFCPYCGKAFEEEA